MNTRTSMPRSAVGSAGSRGPQRAALACALAVAAIVRSSHAVVLAEDEIEDTSADLGVIIRNFDFLLAGKTLAPPFNVEDSDPSAVSILDLRTYASYRSTHWRLVWHQTVRDVVRSHSSLGALSIGGSVTPPRWLPLRFEAADTPTLQLLSETDWAYAAYQTGAVTLTLGRQPVTMGRGRLFHPWDLVATFGLTEVDTEYKAGTDAARLDVSPSSSQTVTLLAAAGELQSDHDLQADWRGSSAMVLAKHGWHHGEFSVMAGLIRNDFVVGYGAMWDLGTLDVYGETTTTWPRGGSLTSPLVARRHVGVLRALLGATLHPAAHIDVTPELYYDGFGARHPRDYVAVATSERVVAGEQVTLGELYAACAVDWQVHPLLHLVALTVSNTLDPSALASVAVVYDAAANTRVSVGGYAPIGAPPRARGSVVPSSEYGLYPYFGFAELRVAL